MSYADLSIYLSKQIVSDKREDFSTPMNNVSTEAINEIKHMRKKKGDIATIPYHSNIHYNIIKQTLISLFERTRRL